MSAYIPFATESAIVESITPLPNRKGSRVRFRRSFTSQEWEESFSAEKLGRMNIHVLDRVALYIHPQTGGKSIGGVIPTGELALEEVLR